MHQAALIDHCNEWQRQLTNLLNENATKELEDVNNFLVANAAKLVVEPQDLAELSSALKLLAVRTGWRATTRAAAACVRAWQRFCFSFGACCEGFTPYCTRLLVGPPLKCVCVCWCCGID